MKILTHVIEFYGHSGRIIQDNKRLHVELLVGSEWQWFNHQMVFPATPQGYAQALRILFICCASSIPEILLSSKSTDFTE